MKASDSKGRDGLRVSYSVIRMVLYVSFYVIDFVVTIWDMMGYVRPAVQIVTITLLIHYCISSTTYAITNYNVNNKQWKLQNIGNSLE